MARTTSARPPAAASPCTHREGRSSTWAAGRRLESAGAAEGPWAPHPATPAAGADEAEVEVAAASTPTNASRCSACLPPPPQPQPQPLPAAARLAPSPPLHSTLRAATHTNRRNNNMTNNMTNTITININTRWRIP